MPPAKKRARTYDPAKIRTAVLAQFGNVRQAVGTLTEEQLRVPTRLGDWTVRELAAHITMAVETVSRNLDRDEPAKPELDPPGLALRHRRPGRTTSPTAPAPSPRPTPTSTPCTPTPRNASPSSWRRPPATGSSPPAPAP